MKSTEGKLVLNWSSQKGTILYLHNMYCLGPTCLNCGGGDTELLDSPGISAPGWRTSSRDAVSGARRPSPSRQRALWKPGSTWIHQGSGSSHHQGGAVTPAWSPPPPSSSPARGAAAWGAAGQHGPEGAHARHVLAHGRRNDEDCGGVSREI